MTAERRGVGALEQHADEEVVVVGKELLGEAFGFEPVAVVTGRRPHGAERVEQREPGDAIGVVDRCLERDDAAPVVTDECAALDAARVEVGDHVVDQHRARDPCTRLLGAAEAAVVGREAGIASVCERCHLVPPLVAGLREPVDEHYRLAGAELALERDQPRGRDVLLGGVHGRHPTSSGVLSNRALPRLTSDQHTWWSRSPASHNSSVRSACVCSTASRTRGPLARSEASTRSSEHPVLPSCGPAGRGGQDVRVTDERRTRGPSDGRA